MAVLGEVRVRKRVEVVEDGGIKEMERSPKAAVEEEAGGTSEELGRSLVVGRKPLMMTITAPTYRELARLASEPRFIKWLPRDQRA